MLTRAKSAALLAEAEHIDPEMARVLVDQADEVIGNLIGHHIASHLDERKGECNALQQPTQAHINTCYRCREYAENRLLIQALLSRFNDVKEPCGV